MANWWPFAIILASKEGVTNCIPVWLQNELGRFILKPVQTRDLNLPVFPVCSVDAGFGADETRLITMDAAEIYNQKRRILYSTFHKGKVGQADAFSYLEGYKQQLGVPGYTGLKAELGFYKKHQEEFSLVVAGDVGDHTDFAANISGTAYRIDVTTNINYKHLKDYEPLQKDLNAKYKIAIVDADGNLDELVDINFPFCPYCSKGRLIDMAVLLGENFNDDGESKWTNDQVQISICNNCDYFEECRRISTHFLTNFSDELRAAREADLPAWEQAQETGQPYKFDGDSVVKRHAQSAVPYLQNQFNTVLMALCDQRYQMTDTDGEGYYCITPKWTKFISLLDGYILDEYQVEL